MTLGAYINICKSYDVELTVYNDPIFRTNSFQLLKEVILADILQRSMRTLTDIG